jgi:branched-chain amino acid transport system substrate-binding protein
MNRTHLLAASLALLSLACEKKTYAPKPVEAKPAEAKPLEAKPAQDVVIWLGEVGSLTGSEAAFGKSTRDGIELALEEANAAGGVKEIGRAHV